MESSQLFLPLILGGVTLVALFLWFWWKRDSKQSNLAYPDPSPLIDQETAKLFNVEYFINLHQKKIYYFISSSECEGSTFEEMIFKIEDDAIHFKTIPLLISISDFRQKNT